MPPLLARRVVHPYLEWRTVGHFVDSTALVRTMELISREPTGKLRRFVSRVAIPRCATPSR